jgi:hypothetical protein
MPALALPQGLPSGSPVLAVGHGTHAQKIRFTDKGLRDLRTAFYMAQEMGEGLARGAILFG